MNADCSSEESPQAKGSESVAARARLFVDGVRFMVPSTCGGRESEGGHWPPLTQRVSFNGGSTPLASPALAPCTVLSWFRRTCIRLNACSSDWPVPLEWPVRRAYEGLYRGSKRNNRTGSRYKNCNLSDRSQSATLAVGVREGRHCSVTQVGVGGWICMPGRRRGLRVRIRHRGRSRCVRRRVRHGWRRRS